MVLALGYGAFRHKSSAFVTAFGASPFLDPCGQQESDDTMKSFAHVNIEIQIGLLEVPTFSNFTDADRPVFGRLSERKFMGMHSVFHHGSISQSPKCVAWNGQPKTIGGFMLYPGFADDGVTKVRRAHGWTTIATATLRKDGRIHLKVDFADFRYCGSPAKKGLVMPTAKGSFVLEDGETAFIGGMKTKHRDEHPYAVPILSELPYLGSWFVVPREVDVDYEMLFLATARIQKSP